MAESDLSQELQARVVDAHRRGEPLRIVGSGSKSFLGPPGAGELLRVAEHSGIISYEPKELVITARAGTRLRDVEAALAEHNQMLAFEPPYFGADATLGGTVACNLSGPRRPYAGAARDFVLGVRLINGHGERLRFGGEVMKNVAGYDLSRLMAGAYGTLGVLLDVTLKVLPRPRNTCTIMQQRNTEDAIRTMNRWAGEPVPLSACAYDGDVLYARLEGHASAVHAAHAQMGGELLEDADFWKTLNEQRHGFFQDQRPLWRVASAPAAPSLGMPGKFFLDWGGALRWFKSDAPGEAVRDAARRAGGHAMLFRGNADNPSAFEPLTPALATLHRRIKTAFDPAGILNRGRLYTDF